MEKKEFIVTEETTDKECEDAVIQAYNECLELGVDIQEVLATLHFIAKGQDNALKKAVSSFASVGEKLEEDITGVRQATENIDDKYLLLCSELNYLKASRHEELLLYEDLFYLGFLRGFEFRDKEGA